MKKIIALLLGIVMLVGLTACVKADPNGTTTSSMEQTPSSSVSSSSSTNTDPNGAMTHAEYLAAEDGTVVTVEFYIQATQGWWYNSKVESGVITVYGQTAEGGYFAYEAKCEEAVGKSLVPGTKVRVTGEKATWNGEIEIMNGTLEIVEGGDTWIAEPTDVTALLGTEELADYQNRKVTFTGMTVVACNDNGDAFMYNWDGSGSEGNDLYFCVSYNGETYTFCVESYLCSVGSPAYEAVRALKVGDTVNMEGFLYWYNTVQPHIYSVTVVA